MQCRIMHNLDHCLQLHYLEQNANCYMLVCYVTLTTAIEPIICNYCPNFRPKRTPRYDIFRLQTKGLVLYDY